MKSYNKDILIWLIVILAVTNLSTVGTIIYRAYFQQNAIQYNSSEQTEIPDNHLGRFFRNELNLSFEQHQQFRDFRQKFHTKANIITNEMQVKRNEMMYELEKEKPDTVYLNAFAKEIGNLHEDLKQLTFEYYFNMKSICNDEQKEKLFLIFNAMTNEKAEIKMPNKKQSNFQE